MEGPPDESIVWCERRESNSHGLAPLDPKSSASTSSATLAHVAKFNPFIFTT